MHFSPLESYSRHKRAFSTQLPPTLYAYNADKQTCILFILLILCLSVAVRTFSHFQ